MWSYKSMFQVNEFFVLILQKLCRTCDMEAVCGASGLKWRKALKVWPPEFSVVRMALGDCFIFFLVILKKWERPLLLKVFRMARVLLGWLTLYVWQDIYYLFICVFTISDRILLRDVKALTLHYDRYTTSRRLDPIPQLKCVGGTAGCDSYTPKVIQCENKGWDGYDVQVIFIMLMAV